jgi:hypothetical protein
MTKQNMLESEDVRKAMERVWADEYVPEVWDRRMKRKARKILVENAEGFRRAERVWAWVLVLVWILAMMGITCEIREKQRAHAAALSGAEQKLGEIRGTLDWMEAAGREMEEEGSHKRHKEHRVMECAGSVGNANIAAPHSNGGGQ